MNPSKVVQVATSVPGILEEVLVERGDVVSQGQPVARLTSELSAVDVEVTGLKASNRATIATAEATVNQARKEFERVDQLVRRDAVSVAHHEEAEARLQIAESALSQASIEHRLAMLAHQRAKSVLASRTIYSPIDGFITKTVHAAGEFLRQDGSVVTVASIDPLHVETFLPVALFPEIFLGMTAEIRPDPPVSGAYPAPVTVVDRIFDVSSGSFGIRLELPNPDGVLPGGHRCKVVFTLGKR